MKAVVTEKAGPPPVIKGKDVPVPATRWVNMATAAPAKSV